VSETVPRLEVAIRSHLLPHLKNDEFSGSGRTFRGIANGWIQVVNVQGSRYGGQFAINLAVHPASIPDVAGNKADMNKITEAGCEFRRRLSESGADQWWEHDGSRPSMDAAVAAAADVYVRCGRPLLKRMTAADGPLDCISPQDFVDDAFNFCGFGSTKVRMALALARLRRAQGRFTKSRAFAAHGLANVGAATALKHEFEQLCSTE
jgi:hypothetical protein